MPPTKEKLCICNARHCCDERSFDEDTNKEIIGRWLNYYEFNQHQKAEKERLARMPADDEGVSNLNRLLMSTTIGVHDLLDATVSKHSKGYKQEEEFRRPTASQQARVEAEEQTSSATENHNPLLSPPTESTVPLMSSLTRFLLDRLAKHRRDFHNARNKFSFEHLNFTFKSLPTFPDQPMPGIPYESANRSSNKAFLDQQENIRRLIESLDQIDVGEINEPSERDQVRNVRKNLVKEVQEYQEILDNQPNKHWAVKKAENGLLGRSRGSPLVVDNSSNFDYRFKDSPGPLVASLLVAVILYILAGLSRTSSNFLLNSLRVIVIATGAQICGQMGTYIPPHPLSQSVPESRFMEADEWPRDIRTAVRTFNLDPDTVHYACCKKCFSIYRPMHLNSPNERQYPQICTFRETPESKICGTRLLHNKTKGEGVVPIRRYIYQPMKSWLGRLLSRPDIEASMSSPKGATNDDKLTDIWHGAAFKNFAGPDKKWFFDAPENELRLSFSLFIDWFNPYGRKRGGRSASVGAIYMVCMNLPPDIRYRVENVYLVGMIPGPHEPSLHHLNHILRPVIDELLEFWNPGVFFTRTAEHKFGCLVKCVIIPVIADLPAMRKTTGFMGVGAHSMCSFCKLEKGDISNLDIRSWPRRSWAEHYEHASLWRDAANEADRANIFKNYHVRWSELLRLPYWDIIRFALVDSMHNFFEGDIKTHILDLWGMSSTAADPSQVKPVPHTPEEQAKSLENLAAAIQTFSSTKVEKSARAGYIEATARLNNITPSTDNPVKKDWANALVKWRKLNPNANVKIPLPHNVNCSDFLYPEPKRKFLLDKEVLQEVWADMSQTTIPSWMQQPPKGVGSPSSGRLKADQWRTFATVNLVITLVRLWSHTDKKPHLDNFLALITAVRFATMRSTSRAHADLVESNLVKYFRGLIDLHGVKALRPNTHMSLHIPECLLVFGPVHGWWTFPFERYNGILARTNTNFKLGEMELTFLMSFCRGAALKALWSVPGLGKIVEDIKGFIRTSFGSDFYGTLLNDIEALDTSIKTEETLDEKRCHPMTAEVAQLLVKRLNADSTPVTYCTQGAKGSGAIRLPPDIQDCHKFKSQGAIFTPVQQSRNDALIHYRTSPNDVAHAAGEIQDIFLHTRLGTSGTLITEHFLSVRPFQPLPSQYWRRDPYRRYPDLDVQLYYDNLEPLVVIKASDIVSHVATCPFKSPDATSYRIVLSLNRN